MERCEICGEKFSCDEEEHDYYETREEEWRELIVESLLGLGEAEANE